MAKLIKGVNDLATVKPDLVKEWHPSKNGDLKPIDVTFRSSTKVWWLCQYGHSFQASPDTRYSGTSCPYCSNKKVLPGWNDFLSYCNTYKLQYLLDEWDYESNDIYPYDILPKTEKKIWWKCNFGHTWVTSPKNRILKKSMCPICQKSKNTSFAEQCLYFYLSKCYSNVVNGSTCVLGSKTLDVYVPEINTGFEFDGARWHTDILLDIEKNELCAKNSVHLYRIREKGCPELPYNEFVTVLSCGSSKSKKAIESCLKLLFEQLDLTCDINVMRDESSIRSLYVAGKKSKSIANMYPNVAIDFDYTKNKNLTPDVVSYASNMRLWWKCHVCGHEWNSIVESRTIHNRGCPECGRLKISRKVLCIELQKEFNSLQDAADFCNLKSTGSLSLACQGKVKTSCGYHWKYVDE